MEKENNFLEQVNEPANDEQIKAAKVDLQLHIDAVNAMAKEIELQQGINEVVKKAPKPLELTHEFHKDPEFWRLNGELNDLKFNRQIVDMQMRLEKSKEIVELKRVEVNRLSGE